MNYIIIVACDVNGGIGKDGKLPWYIPPDMKYFKTVTTEAPENTINAVIMGRKTWESLGKKPLPNRLNIVISATLEDSYIPDADAPIIARSFDHAHTKLKEFSNGSGGICKINNVFVIGGESIYKEALYDYRYTKLYITYIFPNTKVNLLNNIKKDDIITKINDKNVCCLNDLKKALKTPIIINNKEYIKIENNSEKSVIMSVMEFIEQDVLFSNIYKYPLTEFHEKYLEK